MELYFICPETGGEYSTDNYTLQPGHKVTVDRHHAKTLSGTVLVGIACPFCGKRHGYDVSELRCPLSKTDNE